MKKLLSALSFYFAGAVLISAFAGEMIWNKNYDAGLSSFESVIEVSDGLVAVGHNYSALIAKYDNDGNMLWSERFGSNSSYFTKVVAVADGVVAVGLMNSNCGYGDCSGIVGNGSNDAIIVKFDNNGNVLWKKNFGGSGSDEFYSVIVVADGIIAVGNVASNSFGNGHLAEMSGNGNTDAIVVKYDNDGNILWKKIFGGNGIDKYRSIFSVSDGFIVQGSSDNESFGNGDLADLEGKGDVDVVIVKYDNDGNILWKRSFGGKGYDEYCSLNALTDGFILAGYLDTNSFGNGDWADVTEGGTAILVKFDNDGNVLWKRNFGGDSDIFWSAASANGGIIAAGEFYNDDWEDINRKGSTNAVVVKFDNDGNVLWENNFGDKMYDYFTFAMAADNAIIAVGSSFVLDYYYEGPDGKPTIWNGEYNAVIVKFSDSQTDASIPEVVSVDQVSMHTTSTANDLTLYFTKGQMEFAQLELPSVEIISSGTGGIITRLQNYSSGSAINTSHLPQGLYIVAATDNTGKVYRAKFVKQ